MFCAYLRPIHTYTQHGRKVKWVNSLCLIHTCTQHGARSTEHGARSTEHAARSTQHGWKFPSRALFNFPLKTIYLIMRTHDLCVEVWIKIDPCCVLRAACCVLRAACCVLRVPCSVLRAACKYESAFILCIKLDSSFVDLKFAGFLFMLYNYYCAPL